ncbi:MAG TPA: hypothetical protein VK324_04515 [Tepidisphaeraceae bacterium]|nr:hypothetical protein [Tepidisphaeraceae bacterium]
MKWEIDVTTAGTGKLGDGSIAVIGHVWIRDGRGNTVLDTDAINVWPLSDEHRRLIENAAVMADALKKILGFVTGGCDEGDRDAIGDVCRGTLSGVTGVEYDAVTTPVVED